MSAAKTHFQDFLLSFLIEGKKETPMNDKFPPISPKWIPTPQKGFSNGDCCPLPGGGQEEWVRHAGFSDEDLAPAFATGS